jgi:uncharacterized membrane protein YuzA (DUF378 family)
MCGHKGLCNLISLLLIVGAVNWGLVGVGGFMGSDWNVVNMLLGQWPQVLWVVYILVGVSGLAYASMWCKMGKDCACNKKM